jgi:hypothetical protein
MQVILLTPDKHTKLKIIPKNSKCLEKVPHNPILNMPGVLFTGSLDQIKYPSAEVV